MTDRVTDGVKGDGSDLNMGLKMPEVVFSSEFFLPVPIETKSE